MNFSNNSAIVIYCIMIVRVLKNTAIYILMIPIYL